MFISYRRDDSADAAGRIYDRLVQRFGRDGIFKDVDDIPLGVDFRADIGKAVGRCRVLLVVIGRDWLRVVRSSGARRLDDPRDFVRLEIEAALQRGIPVIPVLVSGATMPGEDQLPASLSALAFRNGIEVGRDPNFHRDMDRLLRSLEKWLQDRPDSAPPKEIVNSLGMKFVRVAAGTFWIGDRVSQRQAHIPRDFYMGAFPVTQGQWQAVMGGNPSYFSPGGDGADRVKGFSDADLKRFPVEQVSWEGAQEFIKRLNSREKGRGLVYGFPTEAAWEYGCRGGATSQSGCDFDFYFVQPANDLSSELANFNGSYPAGNAPKGKYLGRTSSVGSYQPNRLGIYDMHGNVWEWCQDHFDAGGSARVIRGGSRYSPDGVICRASNRGGHEPSERFHNVGLRLAAVPSDE